MRELLALAIKTTAPYGILRVVLVCADLQMIGSHTRWMIAFMPDYQTLWYRPVMQFIREYVCLNIVILLAKTKMRIVATGNAIPEPATVAFDYVTPKASLDRNRFSCVVACLAAIFSSSVLYAVRLFKELLTTFGAMTKNATWAAHACPAAKFATALEKTCTNYGEFLTAILANDLNSGRIIFRHESKPQFSMLCSGACRRYSACGPC